MAKTYINKVTFVTEMTTPDGKTVRVILPESMVLDFSAGVGFKTQIVEELPATGDPRTIYLVPSEDEKEGNIYVEWLYIEEEWECVGSTAVAVNLMIGTEAERLAFVGAVEGMEWHETHAADPEDPTSRPYVLRFLYEDSDWKKLEDPQTETVETVSLHISTYDGQGTLEGLQIGITDRNAQSVLHRVLDANGNCTFDIPKGHTYIVSVQSLQGYRDIPDQTYVASIDSRSIGLTFLGYSTSVETVNVHITVYNNALQDITAQDTDMIGLTVTCQITNGDTLTAQIGADHTCQFLVPYGEEYTIIEPNVQGYMRRYAIQWVHTASVPQREVPMHYVEWINVGIYGITEAGQLFTHEDIAQMTAEQKAEIKYIGMNTSTLQAAGASFFYKVPKVTDSKQWAASNVEFDQSLLPFKQSHAAAVQDLDGETNTQNIIDIGDTMGVGTEAADYCHAQKATIAGATKDGFLGAYGQMYQLVANITELNALHTLLGVAQLAITSGYWWTSTQYSAGGAVLLNGGGFSDTSKPGRYTTMALFALS